MNILGKLLAGSNDLAVILEKVDWSFEEDILKVEFGMKELLLKIEQPNCLSFSPLFWKRVRKTVLNSWLSNGN